MSPSPGGRASSRKAPAAEAKETLDRRRHPRRSILQSFGVSAVFPGSGEHRLEIRDLSEDGIGVLAGQEDAVGSGMLQATQFKVGRTAAMELYLNRSLCLPLELEIVRIERQGTEGDGGAGRPDVLIGARWTRRNSEAYAALLGFIQILDKLAAAGRLDD